MNKVKVEEFKVGSAVIVTASNKELRAIRCNKEIKTGGQHKISGLDNDRHMLLDGLNSGLVLRHMIKLKLEKFKVGDQVIVTAKKKVLREETCDKSIKTGGQHTVSKTGNSVQIQLDGIAQGWVRPSMIKLAAPKWSVYTNTLTWRELSKKRKGKMLESAHAGTLFTLGGVTLGCNPLFNCKRGVYKALLPTPTPAPPEPTPLINGAAYTFYAFDCNLREYVGIYVGIYEKDSGKFIQIDGFTIASHCTNIRPMTVESKS